MLLDVVTVISSAFDSGRTYGFGLVQGASNDIVELILHSSQGSFSLATK